MKRFLLRLSIFLICLGTLFFCLLLFTSWGAKRNNDFRIDQKSTNVIFGHSHVEFTYNDKIINNFINLGESGESYFYTLPKIKQIVKNNPQIKRVFLEFTNNQITKNIEDWITEDKYLGYFYALYFPYIEFEDHLYLIKKVPTEYMRNLPIISKDLLKKSISTHKFSSEYGGFKATYGTLAEYRINKAKYKNDNRVVIEPGYSHVQLQFLKKIISYIEQQNIELILVRSPMHNSYDGFTNENDFQYLLENEMSNVKFLDLAKFPLSDIEYRDPEHLNAKGAEKLSKWLNQFLKDDVSRIFKIKKHIDYQFIMDKKNK